MNLSQLRSALCSGAIAIGTISSSLLANSIDLPFPETELPALREILDTALAKAPRRVAQDFELLNAQYHELVSSSRLYPQVGGGYQYQIRQENYSNVAGNQANQRTYYDLAANQAIWHWGAVRATAQHGRLGRQVAEQNLESVRRALAVEVRDAYLGLIVQRLAVRNTLFGEKMADENLARQEARFKAADVTGGVVSDAKLRRDESSLAARKATSDLEFAIRAFRRLTGVGTFSEADLPDRIPDPDLDVPQVTATNNSGYLKSEALLVNEMQIAQWKLSRKIERKALWPKLNAVVGVAQDDNLYSSELNQSLTSAAAFVGVQLHWTIFDGFATKGRRLQSINRIRQLERMRSDLVESLKDSADQQAAAVGFSWSAFKHASLRHQYALGGLSYAKDHLDRGLASEDQVAAAQAAVYQAELVANDALAKFYSAAARYASSMHADPLIDGSSKN